MKPRTDAFDVMGLIQKILTGSYHVIGFVVCTAVISIKGLKFCVSNFSSSQILLVRVGALQER